MCGIVGFIHPSPDAPIDRRALKEALRLIAHRGPDGEGVFIGKGAQGAVLQIGVAQC